MQNEIPISRDYGGGGNRTRALDPAEKLAKQAFCATRWVYFISHDHLVKIGSTGGLPSIRLAQLVRTSPVPLVLEAVVPTASPLERSFHEQFSRWRRHGEWFVRNEKIIEVITEARRIYGVPDPETGIPDLITNEYLEEEFEEIAAELRRVSWRRQVEPLLTKFVRGELSVDERDDLLLLAAELTVLADG